MIRKSILIAYGLIALLGCSTQQSLSPADNALDAGREFIDAQLKGDFERAAFYMLDDAKQQAWLKTAEENYRKLDRGGRQQSREASINIAGVQEKHADTTLIQYSYSFDTTPKTLLVIKVNQQWKALPAFP